MKEQRLAFLLLITPFLCLFQQAAADPPKQKPNIIVILADDLGWADLSCYGSTFHESPNLAPLSDEGLFFTQAYASTPYCSPSRASILPGRNPARLKITGYIPSNGRSGPPPDGVDLMSYLLGKNDGSPHERLFWRFRFDPEGRHPWQGAAREGNYKLVRAWREEPALHEPYKNIGEQNNLIDEMPGGATRLREARRAWEKRIRCLA